MNSTDPEEVSTPARLSGQVLPSASTLQAATAEFAPGLRRCNPDCILLSQTNSNSLCWHLQVGDSSCDSCFCSCDRKGFPSLVQSMQHPFGLLLSSLFCKVEGRRFQFFFYKAVKSTFSGENIASLPAVCCSLVQYSSNLFALGQYFCSVGTVHGSR